MTLQLASSRHRRAAQNRTDLRQRIRYVIILALLIFIMQTRSIVNLMKIDDGNIGVSLESDLLSHTAPSVWDAARKNETLTANSQGRTPPGRPVSSSTSDGVVSRKWAYAFLLGGCNPDEPEYRGFLINVMMVSWRLRKMGTRADVVLFLQMSHKSFHRRLPAWEEQLMKTLNIKFRYIPPFVSEIHEMFYALMMEKFRILQLAGEYSRVLFMDSDQWPLCPLDYVFELSDPPPGKAPRLKENMLMAWKLEPCNGGFFMFAPKPGDFEQISSIIRRREEEVLTMPYPYWNHTIGWGHIFSESDRWRSAYPLPPEKTLEWTWHGAFTDQGLIYYWAKYVKQSVSLIIGLEIEHWGSCNGQACLESTVPSELSEFNCSGGGRQLGTARYPPYGSILHMVGGQKPWVQTMEKYRLSATTEFAFWFDVLAKMEQEILGNSTLSVEIQKVADRRKPPNVGAFPVYNQMFLHIKDKAKRNWNPYETYDDIDGKF